MKIKAYVAIEVRDKKGRLLTRRRQQAHSLLEQFNEVLYGRMSNVTLDLKLTTGTETSLPPSGFSLLATASEGDNGYGVVVGTSDTAVAITDYALGAIVANGSGADQLLYKVVTFPDAPATVGSTNTWTIRRLFENDSGATITIKEAGIYVTVGAIKYVGLCRDVITTTDIPNAATATVTYTWTVAV